MSGNFAEISVNFPISMTMEMKQFGEISSSRNILLFRYVLAKFLRNFYLKEISKKFSHKAFRLMFFVKISLKF